MGILRVKDSIDEIIDRDPYELINIDEPHQMVRRLAPQYYGAAFAGVLVAFVAAFVVFYNARTSTIDTGPTVHAYFEIKAIDIDGRPVAGASVVHNDELVGSTDSFGEWRRFLRVSPGQTYRVELTKSTPSGELVAVKNLAVPANVPENTDVELTGSVKMFFSEVSPGGENPDKNNRKERVVQKAQAVSVPDATLEAVVVDGAAIESVPGLVTNYKSIWFIVDGSQTTLMGDVLSNLRRRSLELGLRVDPAASLRLRLSVVGNELAVKTAAEPSLIRVKGTYSKDGEFDEIFSYLRNFQDTPYQTARDLLWALSMHARLPITVVRDASHWRLEETGSALWDVNSRYLTDASGDMFFAAKKPNARHVTIDSVDFPKVCPDGKNACVLNTAGINEASPVFGWQRLEAKITGRFDSETRIYFSGYEAQKTSDSTVSYWGIANGQANLTVVHKEKVILRKRITHSNGLTIALPTAVISRR
jgi:hypothetical protein